MPKVERSSQLVNSDNFEDYTLINMGIIDKLILRILIKQPGIIITKNAMQPTTNVALKPRKDSLGIGPVRSARPCVSHGIRSVEGAPILRVAPKKRLGGCVS